MSATPSTSVGRGRIGAGTILWWVVLATVVVANLAVLVPAFTTVRLWEDEAFNLTVPLNLLRGLGYTSDGTLSGSELTPFDVRISTGPVLLLPVAALIGLGVDTVIAGRLVGLAGYLLLIGSLWIIGRRFGGRWAGLVAAALPLAFASDRLPSPIQTPVDVLGEVATAGLLAAALAVLHRRPWLAGLFVGLAMQTKFIAVLALPAFALAALFDAPGATLVGRARRAMPRVIAAAACAAAPTVAFELVKLFALGPAGWVVNLREFVWFVRGGGQRGYAIPPIEKLHALLDAWHLPPWLVAVVLVAGVALAVIGLLAVRRDPRLLADPGGATATPREFAVVSGAALLGLTIFLIWWPLSMHTPTWLRHPAPAVLAFAPVLVAATLTLARVAFASAGRRVPVETPTVVGEGTAPAGWRAGRSRRLAAATVGALGVGLLLVSLGGRVALPGYGDWETLADQRAAARDIAELRGDLGADRLASPWGGEVSVVVLSGAHAALVDAGAVVVGDPQVWHESHRPETCESLLLSGRYRVCAPPE
ncbi:hypothetical protein [Agromyces sp. NPDC058126]|uniref:hypothetical protein n=1 Tax=Agromyces sp. NPDC058126 TaxID=3346350 RepID=UPI0036DF70AE